MTDDDRQLVERAQKGDLDAFEQLVEKYRQKVWRLAIRLLRDEEEALDLSQEVFVRAYQSLRNFRGQSAFYTWLFRITMNLATDRQRQRASRQRAFGSEEVPEEEWTRTLPDPSRRPDDEAARVEEREKIRRALDALPLHHRTIIMLSDIEGLTYREIAEVLQCPIGTVMSRLHNARKQLRGLLSSLLGLLLFFCVGWYTPALAQAPTVSFEARVLYASNPSPPVSRAPRTPGQTLVPPSRDPDPQVRPHVNRLREVFGYQSYEQLDLLAGRIPVGSTRRFGLPGGRELEVRPDQIRGQNVRMSVKILSGGAPAASMVVEVPPGRPAMVGGPPYSGGVLIIVISAHPE